jgi:hypothetical protein
VDRGYDRDEERWRNRARPPATFVGNANHDNLRLRLGRT